jgi:hypothetical protein
MLHQKGHRASGDHRHHREPPGQTGQELGGAVEGTSQLGPIHDRGQRPVEIGEDRRVPRALEQWGEHSLCSRRRECSVAGAGAAHSVTGQLTVVVVTAEGDALVARSGPTTTRTSAVPMVVMGSAVVEGLMAEAGRCSCPATALAWATNPAT